LPSLVLQMSSLDALTAKDRFGDYIFPLWIIVDFRSTYRDCAQNHFTSLADFLSHLQSFHRADSVSFAEHGFDAFMHCSESGSTAYEQLS
jgi:hypothetical protein